MNDNDAVGCALGLFLMIAISLGLLIYVIIEII